MRFPAACLFSVLIPVLFSDTIDGFATTTITTIGKNLKRITCRNMNYNNKNNGDDEDMDGISKEVG